MNSYKLSVIRLKQNTSKNQEIFVGTVKVKDLLGLEKKDRDLRFKIHQWKNNDNTTEKGYQRAPEQKRIEGVKKYLQREVEDPIFPTAVLVSARKPILFVAKNSKEDFGELTIDQPLYIIDGQHRIEAFKDIMQNVELSQKYGFIELPITILSGFEYKEEVEQFFIINSRQKSIKTDLAQRIFVEIGKGDTKTRIIKDTDKWQMPVITVVDKLNKNPKSPWYHLIALPDDDKDIKKERTINQNSFVKSLKPFFIGATRRWIYDLDKSKDGNQIVEQCEDLINGYWEMIESVYPNAFENKKNSILFKTAGVFSLHIVLADYLNNHPDKTIKEIISEIKKLLIVARDDNSLKPTFWVAGNKKDRERGLNAGAYSSSVGHNRIAMSILHQKDIRYL